jgi:hypothetical protein
MTPKGQPTHPADLPCIDPDCRGSRPTGTVLCQRCSARIERAHRDHRLRYQNRPSGPPDHDDYHDYHERTP